MLPLVWMWLLHLFSSEHLTTEATVDQRQVREELAVWISALSEGGCFSLLYFKIFQTFEFFKAHSQQNIQQNQKLKSVS